MDSRHPTMTFPTRAIERSPSILVATLVWLTASVAAAQAPSSPQPTPTGPLVSPAPAQTEPVLGAEKSDNAAPSPAPAPPTPAGSEWAPAGPAAEPRQPVDAEPSADEDTPGGAKDELASAGPRGLSQMPTPTLGLEASGGLALLVTSQASASHMVAGGLLRAKLRYFQLGAAIEVSDHVEDGWSSIGGFAGAWLPYRNWVNLDLTVGGAVRTYSNSSVFYGPDGYKLGTPSLSLRAGISDRSSEGLFGVRLGAAFVAAFDLKPKEAAWQMSWGEGDARRTASGTTAVGGITLGLLVHAGFDIGLSHPPVHHATNVLAGSELPHRL